MKNSLQNQFIYLMCFIFLIFAFLPVLKSEKINIIFIIVPFVIFLMNMFFSKLFTPIFLAWMFIGKILEKIIPPIIMSIIFFTLFFPIGFFLKLIGKDLLNKKFEKEKESYWIIRNDEIQSMRYQF
ncbi:putative membrane protein [Arcobacter venerupis]|uniref:Membrane protein n=1 Tax=Arcobacter venerupis TaxID=1054033 RepID=A0AAE7BBI2_9BACT|nr:hypothetical protein [Arcobacter venerupis]QKF67354.1 putative membrane protein [Arcobacter venerupis]RWS50631.1 hypothetical protein CKA56_03605 [Arcobacter venerupis]